MHTRWLGLLEEEFFRQGDLERGAGLPISPLFDRTKQGVSKSQVGARWATDTSCRMGQLHAAQPDRSRHLHCAWLEAATFMMMDYCCQCRQCPF